MINLDLSNMKTCWNCKHYHDGYCSNRAFNHFDYACWEGDSQSVASTQVDLSGYSETSTATTVSVKQPEEQEIMIQSPVHILDNGGFIRVYQVEYSKGSYDDFRCWCGENVYFKKEDAEKELEDFLEENSIESLQKRLKVTTFEYWESGDSDFEKDFPRFREEHSDMSDDDIHKALLDDCTLYWDYLDVYNQYNYKLCKVIERKLR